MKKLILLAISVLFLSLFSYTVFADGEICCYVSETGSDDNPGTEQLPFRTVAYAVEKIGFSDGTVVISGRCFWDGVKAHTGKITFEGADPEKVSEQMIDFSEKNNSGVSKGSLHLMGDSVFRNITFVSHDESQIFTDGHDLSLEGKIGYINETEQDQPFKVCVGGIGLQTDASTVVLSAQAEIDSLSIGYNAMSSVTGKTALTICGTDVKTVYLCGNGAQIGDVEITITSGSLGSLETKKSYKTRSKINGSLFISANDGLGVDFLNHAEVVPTAGICTISCEKGAEIEKIPGGQMYKVTSGNTLVARNTETGETAISSLGGHIALPAGSYEITKSATDYFTNDGSKISVLSPISLDFDGEIYTRAERDGEIFAGWFYKGTGTAPKNGEMLSAGAELEAKFVDCGEKGFLIDGVKIKPDGISFVANRPEEFESLSEIREFGITVLPEKLLKKDKLLKNGAYERDGHVYYSRSSLASDGDAAEFVLKGITPSDYDFRFCAAAYAVYITANGTERTIYSDIYTAGIADVIKDCTANKDKDGEVFKMVKKQWENQYFGEGTTPVKSAAYENAYEVNGSGIHIKEITLERGLEKEVTVAMITDSHLHTSTPKAVETLEKSMKYASFADKTVLCGDNIEAISSDADIELFRKAVWEPYPETICTIGNHDLFYGDNAELRAKAEKIWPHNPWYYSELIGEKVLVVSAEDAESVFTEAQCDMFEKDLEKARENGYTVLFFHHISIRDISKSTGANARMYALVKEYSDVIAACFSGHNHVDEYREIVVNKEDADGNDIKISIPCYKLESNNGDPDNVDYTGNVLYIRIK